MGGLQVRYCTKLKERQARGGQPSAGSRCVRLEVVDMDMAEGSLVPVGRLSLPALAGEGQGDKLFGDGHEL